MNRYLLVLGLIVIGVNHVGQAQPTEQPTLAQYMLSTDRVLHGYGMDMFRWHTDAVPYIEASVNKPVIYGSYIVFTDIRNRDPDRLEQLRRLGEGWTDPTDGRVYPILPLMGVHTWRYDFQDRRDTLAAAYFRVLGISQAMMDAAGIDKPVYSMSLFGRFQANPSLWGAVRDTLQQRGLHTQDIDLGALLADGSDEAAYRLIALRDSALVLASQRLQDRGMQFSDLAVLEGHFDAEIAELADSLKVMATPYLVRFLYEAIEGVSRPVIFSRETYIAAHRRVVDIFRARGATNVEFIYHANAGNLVNLEAWYPGDAYIDWVSPSIYHSLHEENERKRANDHHAFAVQQNKPVIIAESGPTDDKYRPNNVDYPGVWEDWFAPYFDFIQASTHVRAFIYIGVDHSLLVSDFQDWGNTRLIENPTIFAQWEAELAKPVYVHNTEFWDIWEQTTTSTESDPLPQTPTVAVWPNPFSETLHVLVGGDFATGAQVQLFDVQGRLVAAERMSSTGVPFVLQGISGKRRAASGVYFVRVGVGDRWFMRPVVRVMH